jgi:hypothetical protein
MNTNLCNALKRIVTEKGEAALNNTKQLNSLLSDYAPNEPKPEKKALITCLMDGCHTELKNAPESGRRNCKNRLAQKLHDDEGIELSLYQNALDILESVFFGTVTPKPLAAPQAAPQPVRQTPAAQTADNPSAQTPPARPGTGNNTGSMGSAGDLAKNVTRKSRVFGIAGGIGAVAGEILSEPIYSLSPSSFMGIVLFTASWAGLISLGVSVGLLIAQNIYLKKRLPSKSFIKTAILGIVSGAVAGAVAQVLFAFTNTISTAAEIISRIICWGIMACGVGMGVSLFVPNYPRKRAMLAGLLGGIIGGALFRASFGLLPDVAGRIFGIGILGVFIGLTISIVEEILREAWITIDWGKNETTNVSLGKNAVALGSSPEADVYLPRNKFPPVAAVIKIENSKVIVGNKLDNRCLEIADNSELNLGTVKITVHTKKGN